MGQVRPHIHLLDIPLASRGERFAFATLLVGFAAVYVLAVLVISVVVAIALTPVRILSWIAGANREAKQRR
ncbi:MAG TPA: hypothetical protein VF573_02260 [Paraburkholderia sp.]|uniref:hypothetical protein n=1 Tax=unclassified Paraburkholderia TaxID=2615204 RepID=UPI002E170FB6|nr:hypothetical protein [Paraburkholderia sp. MPAMCS5]